MPTDVEVKWYGDDLLAQIEAGTPDGLFAGGEMLVNAAASKAPRASGDLANSGYVNTTAKSTYRKDKKHRKEVKAKTGEAVAGFAAFYARFVEYGTSKHAARPFFRPALDELKDKIGEKITITIGQRIKNK